MRFAGCLTFKWSAISRNNVFDEKFASSISVPDTQFASCDRRKWGLEGLGFSFTTGEAGICQARA